MKPLPLPKNNRQEVLLTLIKNGKVSIKDYPYLSGFRARISEIILDHGLALKPVPANSVNKFGRTITYMEHHLDEKHIDDAIKIYNSLNN